MKELKVACLQLRAFDLEQAEESLAYSLERIDEAGQRHPDLMVLPECTYPAYYLHSLETYHKTPLRPHEEVVRLFAERARKHSCYLVAGIARPEQTGWLSNAAYLYDPDGKVIATYTKSFLWHFDQYWFNSGSTYPTFDLPFGRTGMFICADGRMPEVVRALGVGLPRLLIDTTAWVSSGGNRSTLSNPQFDYMIPVRAIENGAWIAVANKVGIEAECVVYCGRSCIVAPDGRVVAQAGSDKEQIVEATIDLDEARGPILERQPNQYSILMKPTHELPVTQLLSERVAPAETTVRVGLLQLKPYTSAGAYIDRIGALAERLVHQEARLVVLPGVPVNGVDSPAYQAKTCLPELITLSARLKCGFVAPLVSNYEEKIRLSAFIIAEGEKIGEYHQMHLDAEQSKYVVAGEAIPVFETPYGRLGIMLNEEGLVPEIARVLMLQGAELIAWPVGGSSYPLSMVARCRADENKVFLALATPLEPGKTPHTALFHPAGMVLAAALPDIEQGIAGQVTYAFARIKEMAPNTDVVHNRQPASYRQLVS